MKMLQREHRSKCCRYPLGLPKGVAERSAARRNGNPPTQGIRAGMIRPAACQVRRSRGQAQNVNICTPALMATKYPAVEHIGGSMCMPPSLIGYAS